MEKMVTEAILAEAAGDYEKAADLCRQILDKDSNNPEIRILLGRCYLSQEMLHTSEKVFLDLLRDYPNEKVVHLYLGRVYYAMDKIQESVKELEQVDPLEKYDPFYYVTYGNALLQLDKKEKSREMFYKEVSNFEATKDILEPVILNEAYRNLLYLDILLFNGHYSDDMKSYYHFLDSIEMTEEMQEHVASTMVYLCNLMVNKWYRSLFLEFITYIKQKNYLTTEPCLETLKSAFASRESFQYHEDRHIEPILEAYLLAVYDRNYVKKEMVTSEKWDRVMMMALTYEWYMCQYFQTHQEQIDYIKNTYPYSYEDCRDFLEKVNKDAKQTAEEILDMLCPYMKNMDKEALRSSMYKAYLKLLEDKKEAEFIDDGIEPYKRVQPKIGRNDPCPCGSGLKYKKCCGKVK